jgi:hypothetical protein
MRHTLAAGTLALAVVVVACGGEPDSSGIDGLLRVSGGRSTAGTVSVYPATAEDEGSLLGQPIGVEPIAELAVDSAGEFRISLPPGTYMLAAQTVSSGAWQMQSVEVSPGEYTPVTITCYFG